MTLKRIASGLIASGLLIALLAWLTTPGENRPGQSGKTIDDRLDYWITNLELDAYDISGQPSYRLQAQRMSHSRLDDSHLVEHPRLTFFVAPAPPWKIRADRGLITAGSDEVQLNGNVRIRGQAANGHQALSLKTEKLNIQPQERFMESQEAVTIESEKTRTDAVGMRAYLDRQRLQLLSRVRTHHEP